MSANVIEFTSLAKRVRQALDRYHKHNEQGVEVIMDLATALWAARQAHSSNQAFGIWVAENELDDLNRNDRAALIGMGQNPDLARKILADTDRVSLCTIWQDLIKPKVEKLPSSQPCEDAPTRQTTTKVEEIAPPTKKSSKLDSSKESSRETTVAKRNPLLKLKRGEEVVAIYQNKDTRTFLGRLTKEKGWKPVWDLILQVLDEGLLVSNNTGITTPSLKLLFPGTDPGYCRRFDLTQAKHRSYVMETILPAVLASREAYKANPEALEDLVKAYELALRKQTADDLAKEQIKKLPANEQEIIMYGQRLWPRADGEGYNYKELRSGIWWFKDLFRWVTPQDDLASRLLTIRLVTRPIHSFVCHELEGDGRARIETLLGVVDMLTRLSEKNPDGECKAPSPPHHDKEW